MDFLPIALEDREHVTAALAADPPSTSELTFTNLWVWRGARAIALGRDEDGALVARCEEHGARFFLPPVGARDAAATARRLVGVAREQGFPFEVRRAPAALADALRAAGFAAREDRDSFDYVYEVGALASLEGRHFDGKRNQVRRLTRERACAYAPLDAAVAAECLALEEDWCDLRACRLDAGLTAEQAAIGECLRLHRELGLIGGVIRVDGRVKAFALAERLAGDTAVVHFEKADPQVPGLYQLVNHWFCREALGAFRFVNREQDLGIPGLRQAKESWRPHHLVAKFTVAAAGAPPAPPPPGG
jgi:hypothetical protein